MSVGIPTINVKIRESVVRDNGSRADYISVASKLKHQKAPLSPVVALKDRFASST